MPEKDEIPDTWIIEVYDGRLQGWCLSKLNETGVSHTLEWCMEQWTTSKAEDEGVAFRAHRYRLRNIANDAIIMCGIL